MSVPRTQRGFTIVELLLVIVITGIMTAVAMPRFRDALTASRINRVSRIVASDLEVAVSLASRQRRPVRIECDCPNRLLRVVDRVSGAVLHQRSFGGAQDLAVGAMALSTPASGTSIIVFPNGLASAPLTVTLTDGSRSRSVTLGVAGSARLN